MKLPTLEKSDLLYAAGLIMLFAGLTLGVSVATALIITGSILAAEAVITSYVAMCLNAYAGRK